MAGGSAQNIMTKTAVLLAAGRGARLRPLTDSVPKPLVQVGAKPIVDRIVDELDECRVNNIVLVVGHLGYKIRDHYARRPNAERFTFLEQDALDGTAGAVRLCAPYIRSDFLVLFADSLFAKGSIRRVVESPSPNAIAVVRVSDPRRYGVVEMDQQNRITDLVEKPEHPTSDYAIAGMYKMQLRCRAYFHDLVLSPRGEYELPDVVRRMITDGIEFRGVPLASMIDIGTLEQLDSIQHLDI